MELQTISQVSRQLNVSTRTLRYYEQIGLITPQKKEDFSFRTYDPDTLVRIQQILFLRKLRIPLKQIREILEIENITVTIQVFEENLSEIEEELTALSTIRGIIKTFIEKLNVNASKMAFLEDEKLLAIVDSLAISKNDLKEDKKMADLNQTGKKSNKLSDRDVRIVYLPPSAVASYQYVGEDPEMHCNQVIDKFVLDTGLIQIKPDIRHYGFNAPNPVDETNDHGYEVWVTIPDDMEVTSPMIKKHFEGGLYAAHMIPMGAFEEWSWLCEWVKNNSKYQGNNGNKGSECMCGLLEEHLNYIHHVHLENTEPEGMQMDLLYPIREIESEAELRAVDS